MQELLADLSRRIRRLEQPQFVSLGDYRITQNSQGQLTVEHIPSSTITVIAEPPAVEDQDTT